MLTETKPNADAPLIVYGHDWCPQAKLLATILNKNKIEYEWRDVKTGEESWQAELKQLANGNLSVPTVVFSDQTVMVEPWPNTVLKKLRVNRPSWLKKQWQKYFNRPSTPNLQD